MGDSGDIARFFAIDTATAQIVAEQPLDGPPAAFVLTIANPYATTFDDEHVVFPSTHGAYVVDTSLDLPLFRVPLGCCNVAASPTTNEFYFAHISGSVSIVRLNP